MYSRASSPSLTTWTRSEARRWSNASSVNSASNALSSTRRTSADCPDTITHPNREIERGSHTCLGLRPDVAAVPADDALDDRQPSARSRKFVVGMETFEHPEELVQVAHVEPDAVVSYVVDRPIPAAAAERADLDPRSEERRVGNGWPGRST